MPLRRIGPEAMTTEQPPKVRLSIRLQRRDLHSDWIDSESCEFEMILEFGVALICVSWLQVVYSVP